SRRQVRCGLAQFRGGECGQAGGVGCGQRGGRFRYPDHGGGRAGGLESLVWHLPGSTYHAYSGWGGRCLDQHGRQALAASPLRHSGDGRHEQGSRMMLSTRASRSPWVLASLMTLAMGMPMMVFYAIGVLGPQIIQDLGISREQLGWLTTSTFGLAALLSPWAGALVQRMGNRQGLFLLFLLVAMSFSLIAVLPGFWGVLMALLLCGLAQS